MRKLLTLTAAAALVVAFGFAGPAQAHEGYDCRAKESGSYLAAAGGAGATGADLVISHGKASELGRTRSQGAFLWGTFVPEASLFCAELVEGHSVTRASNGDLVFVTYAPGSDSTNCGDGGSNGTVDIVGEVTGGTGNFAAAGGQAVHTISQIHVSGFTFGFGGVTTDSHSECLED